VAFLVACSAIAQSLFPSFTALGKVVAGGRLSGTLGNPIYLGGYETFSIFLAVLLFRGLRGMRRGLLLVAVFAAVWAMVLAGSRGAMVGLAAGLTVLMIILGIDSRYRRLVMSATAGLLVVAVAYGLFAGLIAGRPWMTPFWNRHSNLQHFFYFTETGRMALSMAAWDGFLSKPLFGWGLGGFEPAFDSLFRPVLHFMGRQDKAHNIPMGVLCETGVIGGLAYLALWAGFVVTAVRAARKGALSWQQGATLLGAGAGYFVYGLFAPDSVATDLAITVTFVAVASSTSVTEQVAPSESTSVAFDPRRFAILGFASAAALVVLWFGSLSPFTSSYLMKKTLEGASRASGDSTVARVEKAQSFWTPYLDDQVGLLLSMAQVSTQSASAPTWAQREILTTMVLKTADRYLRLNPSHARHRGHIADGLVKIARASNRPDIEKKAEALYRQSIAESPNRQMYRLAYGSYLAQAGRLDEAENQYRKALASAPGMGEVMWSLGRFLWGVRHNDDEGSRLLVQATERAGDERYHPESMLEWLQLIQAMRRQQMTDKLRATVATLPSVAPGDTRTAMIYVEIAKVLEDAAMFHERDNVLQLGTKQQPALAMSVARVLNGSARLRGMTIPQL
jgi:Tfp pilus assembly protein PilF